VSRALRQRIGRRAANKAWARANPPVLLRLRDLWTGEEYTTRRRVILLAPGVWGMLP
jgi:hypothetical protein